MARPDDRGSSLSGALSDQLSIPGSGVETSARIADRFGSGEREVMALVAEGLSTEEIASRLVISRATAKTHVNRAMFKLGARDRAQLVVIAYRTGLVHPQR